MISGGVVAVMAASIWPLMSFSAPSIAHRHRGRSRPRSPRSPPQPGRQHLRPVPRRRRGVERRYQLVGAIQVLHFAGDLDAELFRRDARLLESGQRRRAEPHRRVETASSMADSMASMWVMTMGSVSGARLQGGQGIVSQLGVGHLGVEGDGLHDPGTPPPPRPRSR